MGAAAKHAYRFGYLKSEQWADVRLACLMRDGAKCRICGVRDLSNDAHHIRYPKNWYDTTIWHLVTLCRQCHEKVHSIMDQNPVAPWKKIRFLAFPEGHLKKVKGKDRASFWGRLKFHHLTILIAWTNNRNRLSVDWLSVLLNRRFRQPQMPLT